VPVVSHLADVPRPAYHPASREVGAMNRRVFVTGLGAVLAAPLAAKAEQARMYKIGFLSSAAGPHSYPSSTLAFRQELRERGWVEGQNISIEYRWAGARIDDVSSLAEDLVKLRVDVIVAGGNRAVSAAKTATSDVPIVMSHSLDPVGSGLVASLAKPGGNVTGLTWDAGPEIAEKRLQLFKTVSPGLSRVINLWDPREPGLARYWPAVTRAAESLGCIAESAEVRTREELERALLKAKQDRAGIFVWAGPFLNTHSKAICDFALSSRLPTLSPTNEYISKDGCLIGYAPSTDDVVRRAGIYVDRILRGARPGDLPVEQPVKFELAINLKTAKTLGLTIPPSLLLRADQVIE